MDGNLYEIYARLQSNCTATPAASDEGIASVVRGPVGQDPKVLVFHADIQVSRVGVLPQLGVNQILQRLRQSGLGLYLYTLSQMFGNSWALLRTTSLSSLGLLT